MLIDLTLIYGIGLRQKITLRRDGHLIQDKDVLLSVMTTCP